VPRGTAICDQNHACREAQDYAARVVISVTAHGDAKHGAVIRNQQCSARGQPMIPNQKQVLHLMTAELEFLESGGYRASSRSPWRSPYVFEESPSCPNFPDPSKPHNCQDCWLMRFVRPDLRDEPSPCRFIQLTANGESVDSLYRYGTQEETEAVLRKWLGQWIRELESDLSEAALLPFASRH
jgi:hypothetical protein